MRFHLIKGRETLETVVPQFTRLMFGLSSLPFVLKTTQKHHLEQSKKNQSQTVVDLKQNMYVDDVIQGEHS